MVETWNHVISFIASKHMQAFKFIMSFECSKEMKQDICTRLIILLVSVEFISSSTHY